MSDDSDPFDYFDRATGADTVRNPYPEFAEQRRRCPVQKVDLRAMAKGISEEQAQALPNVYQVLSHDLVSQVLRDGQTFSSSFYSNTMGAVMGHSILEMDAPEHGRYRGLIQKAFSKKALERWEDELVRPIVNGFIDRFVERGRADLVRELTFPFPVHVIAGMLGLPHADLPQFHRWTVELISVGFDWETGVRASQHLAKYLQPFLDQRRADPTDDLISVLAHAELDGQRLTDEEILAFLRLLLPAGAETTYRSTSNLLFGLLSNTDQLEAVRNDRSLIPQAMEEGLRWEPPLTGIARVCTRDVELAGVQIPAGSTIGVNLGAANHDDTRYEDPERFDIFRPARQHMAFAFGPHRCLGMHLATMETEVVLGSVLDRLPGLRLDPAAVDIHITGQAFRSPRKLPVRFGAQ